MTETATNTLTADDDLYDALYDVRREAGFLRELLHLPTFHRHKGALDRQGYTCFTFEACEAAFRDNVNLSNNVYRLEGDGTGEKTMGILEMDNPEHFAFRKAVQSLFIRPRAQKWWRQNFIDELVG